MTRPAHTGSERALGAERDRDRRSMLSRNLLTLPTVWALCLIQPQVRGMTTIVQNASPYTYFGNRPVEMGEGARIPSLYDA